jgi:flagellin
MNILANLRTVNSQVALHQLRLGTGLRINNAEDDPAGYSIATKLDNRNRILQAVYDNIGQAGNMLSVAEGGLQSINDILVQLSQKIESAASDSLGTDERKAISTQLAQMVSEINDTAQQTKFGSVAMLNSNTTLHFQTGEADSTDYTTQKFDSSNLGMTNLTALTPSTVIDSSNYQSYLDEVNNAILTVNTGLTDVGSLINRFSIKSNNIQTTQTNTESALSRIRDADMAQEQLDLTKNQILMQTSTAMLAQANTNSQSILTLFK